MILPFHKSRCQGPKNGWTSLDEDQHLDTFGLDLSVNVVSKPAKKIFTDMRHLQGDELKAEEVQWTKS